MSSGTWKRLADTLTFPPKLPQLPEWAGPAAAATVITLSFGYTSYVEIQTPGVAWLKTAVVWFLAWIAFRTWQGVWNPRRWSWPTADVISRTVLAIGAVIVLAGVLALLVTTLR